MAQVLSRRPGVLAVLFYGNMQRNPDAHGLLDFYVLTESDRAYYGRGLSALANRLLPPNVFLESVPDGPKAKVAVMRLDAFAHRMRWNAWDTTLWARFCQPAVLAYSRDHRAYEQVLDAIVQAHETAAHWAIRFVDSKAGSTQAWEALFRYTYGAELRVEGSGRAQMLAAQGAEIYALLHIASRETGPAVTNTQALRAWRKRRLVGKFLNAARLIKACFTFRGAIAYALDKVERHSGRPVSLSDWEKRHPWIAAPWVFVRLLRERRLR